MKRSPTQLTTDELDQASGGVRISIFGSREFTIGSPNTRWSLFENGAASTYTSENGTTTLFGSQAIENGSRYFMLNLTSADRKSSDTFGSLATTSHNDLDTYGFTLWNGTREGTNLLGERVVSNTSLGQFTATFDDRPDFLGGFFVNATALSMDHQTGDQRLSVDLGRFEGGAINHPDRFALGLGTTAFSGEYTWRNADGQTTGLGVELGTRFFTLPYESEGGVSRLHLPPGLTWIYTDELRTELKAPDGQQQRADIDAANTMLAGDPIYQYGEIAQQQAAIDAANKMLPGDPIYQYGEIAQQQAAREAEISANIDREDADGGQAMREAEISANIDREDAERGQAMREPEPQHAEPEPQHAEPEPQYADSGMDFGGMDFGGMGFA